MPRFPLRLPNSNYFSLTIPVSRIPWTSISDFWHDRNFRLSSALLQPPLGEDFCNHFQSKRDKGAAAKRYWTVMRRTKDDNQARKQIELITDYSR